MDLALTDEQLAFRQVAREWLDATVVPHRRDWDRAEQVDTSIIRGLGEMGFLGLTIPEEYGGIGGDYITYAMAMEELGRADIVLVGAAAIGEAEGRLDRTCDTHHPTSRWFLLQLFPRFLPEPRTAVHSPVRHRSGRRPRPS